MIQLIDYVAVLSLIAAMGLLMGCSEMKIVKANKIRLSENCCVKESKEMPPQLYCWGHRAEKIPAQELQ